MERYRPAAEVGHTLESLLSPLLETLSRVSTNIYLPVRKSDRSLQLVLQLLKLGETPNCQCQQGLQLDLVLPFPSLFLHSVNSRTGSLQNLAIYLFNISIQLQALKNASYCINNATNHGPSSKSFILFLSPCSIVWLSNV